MNLFQFQKEAVEKFFKSGSLLVAITTGGGKTVVALDIINKFLRRYKDKFRCLIISPANLRQNFVSNIQKFKLKINSCIVTKINEFNECYEKFNVLIISYNFLRMYYNDVISDKKWTLVICDELHYAKNRQTINFKTIWKLRQNTKHFLGLTASPLMNTPEEFFAIVSIVANNPEIFKYGMKLIQYKEIGKVPLWKQVLLGQKPKKVERIPVGIKNIEDFKTLVAHWVYIPKYEKIASTTSRPEIKSYTLNVDLTKFEVSAYLYSLRRIPKDLLNDLKNGSITEADLRKIKNSLMACQQTLLSPDYIYEYDPESVTTDISKFRPGSKVKAVARYLKKTNEKSIVYTPFLLFGARLANHYFNSIGIKSAEYSGRIPQKERQKIVDNFENGDLQVICLTGAGQEGINLPSCKNVIFLSLHFNPQILSQVTGRALRATSRNKFVKILWIFALANGKETIDHWISRVIKRKSIIKNVIFSVLEENIKQESGNVSVGLTSYETLSGKKVLKQVYPDEVIRGLSWTSDQF